MATVDYTKHYQQFPNNPLGVEEKVAPSASNNQPFYEFFFKDYGYLNRSQYFFCFLTASLIIPLFILKLIQHKGALFNLSTKKAKFKAFVLLLLSCAIAYGYSSNDFVPAGYLGFVVGIYLLVKIIIFVLTTFSRISSKRLADTGAAFYPISNVFLLFFIGFIGTLINFFFLLISPSVAHASETNPQTLVIS